MSLRSNIALATCSALFGLSLMGGATLGAALIYSGLTGLMFATAFALNDNAPAQQANVRVRGRRRDAEPEVVVVRPWYTPLVRPSTWFPNLFATHNRVFVPRQQPHVNVGHRGGVQHTRTFTPARNTHGGGVTHTRTFRGNPPPPDVRGAHGVTHTRTFRPH